MGPVSRSSGWHMDCAESKAKSIIQEGEANEISPWLERAQWHQYSVGSERPEVMSCVSEPNKDKEPVEATIWPAMDGLIQFCQESIVSRVGILVGIQAIQTEKHQTRYQPLQPYMDVKALGDYSRPWKQVLMFFARTRKRHKGSSPKYRFTSRQRDACEALVARAEQSAEPSEEHEVGEMEENDKGDGEDGQDSENGEEGEEAPQLTAVEKACLGFCIKLLDQRINWKEYDSALVCALAVLSVNEGGWKGPDQYPPIWQPRLRSAGSWWCSNR